MTFWLHDIQENCFAFQYRMTEEDEMTGAGDGEEDEEGEEEEYEVQKIVRYGFSSAITIFFS